MSSDSVRLLTPELIVVLTATAIYLLGAFMPGKRFWGALGVVGLVAAGFSLIGQYESLFWVAGQAEPLLAANVPGPMAADMLGLYIRLLALVVGGALVLTAGRPQSADLAPEITGTIMMAVAGLMLVGGARELVMMFLGLELISIPTYVLLFIGRRNSGGAESAAKYFFLSILSSGLTLYGFSFLYGVGGTTDLAGIRTALENSLATSGSVPLFAQLALILVFAGLGFKIAAVPFHFYAPDVYQGTTHGNAGLLSILPKAAGIAALVRIVSVAMPGVEDTAVRVALILSMLTMTLGNVTALWQNDVRRMFAYSSIAHAGYMLIGLAVDFAARRAGVQNVDGVGATLVYIGVYAAATAGSFAAFAYLGGRDRQIDTVDDLAGVGRSHPGIALAVAVFMFSLAGIPPLAGFWGKFALFSGSIKIAMISPDTVTNTAMAKLAPWFLVLSIVGVLNAAIAAAYYLRIIGVMYFRDSTVPAAGEGGTGAKIAAFACAILTVVLGLSPEALSVAAGGASKSARLVPGETPSAAVVQHAAVVRP